MTKEEMVVKIDNVEIDEMEIKYSNVRSLTAWGVILVSVIAIAASLFHLYTSGFGMQPYTFHLSIHLAFMVVLAYLIYPISKRVLTGKKAADKIAIYDLVLAALGAAVCWYQIIFYNDIVARTGIESSTDLLVAAVGIVLVLEAARRTVGPALAILAVLFIGYAFFGHYLPDPFTIKAYSVQRVLTHLWYTGEGIFGTPLYVVSWYVIVFIMFGAFLKYSGAGEFFINLAYALTGYRKGGPAKTAIMASGLLGMINGSSIANTVTTGVFTIPLMKRAGYRKEFAGAMEAAASTGGQIMPPIMGAAAFLMVEYTGIPYNQIIIAAAIPAIAFFFGLWVMAHFEAGRANLRTVPKSELPNAWKLIKEKGYMGISILLLLYLLLVANISIVYAGFFSIIAVVVVSWFNKDTRMGLKKIRLALEEGSKSVVGVALACACAGIISGVATLTGLGLSIASLVGSMASQFGIYFAPIFGSVSMGALFVALIVTMVACLVLGMGLPTTATYVVLVIMAAPAIMQLPELAIPILSVHMFVLYYGVLADITPPVALAAYAASGIAKSNQFWTGVEAFKISLNKLLVPFAFVFSPAILLIGVNWNDIGSIGMMLFDVMTIFIGIVCLQAAICGWMLARCTRIERLVLFAAALLLIFPNIPGAVFGVGALLVIAVLQKARIIAGPDGKATEGLKKLMSNPSAILK